MLHAGVILACALISSTISTRWDARAPGPHAYATLELDFFISRSRIPTPCLHAHGRMQGGVRLHKSRVSACCALPAAAYECWAAALHLCPQKAISQTAAADQSKSSPKSSCPQSRGGHPVRLLGEPRPYWQVVPILNSKEKPARIMPFCPFPGGRGGGAKERTGCQNG